MRYEIRAMSFGEILDTGFQLLRNHFSLLVGLSLVLYVPTALLYIALGGALQSGQDLAAAFGVAAVLPLALTILVVAPIVSAAITYAVGKLYLGDEVGFGEAIRVAFSLTLPVVGTSLMSFLVIAVGLVLLVIPGVYFMLAYLLLWQVMVLEDVFGSAALRRSADLMKGSKLRAIGVLVIGGIVVSVLSTGLQLATSFVPLLGSVASAAAQAIGNVYTTAISVVLYFDIRCRKEAFDLEHLARLVQRHGGGVAAPVR